MYPLTAGFKRNPAVSISSFINEFDWLCGTPQTKNKSILKSQTSILNTAFFTTEALLSKYIPGICASSGINNIPVFLSST